MELGFVEVYQINPAGNVISFGIAQNHWGCATLIWHDLALRYRITSRSNILSGDGYKVLKTLGASIGTGKFERWEELILACTFDRIWIPKYFFQELLEAFEKFYERKASSAIVPTTREISILLRQMNDTSAIGAAFNMCSKLPSFWVVSSQDGGKRAYNLFSENHTSGDYVGKTHISIEKYVNKK